MRLNAMRVMTWNIHGAIECARWFELERVVNFISAIEPDIVALQEVDSRHLKDGRDVFTVLQESLGNHGIGAKSIIAEDGGYYGQMLISRWPIREVRVEDISYGEFEPRQAVSSCIETPQGPLRVVATHLGLSIKERREQVRALLRMAAEPARGVVLLGDFNDWFWPGSVRRVLCRELPGYSRHRTFPSLCPVFRLDRIFCRPADILVRCWTDVEARHISDHLPVMGELTLAQARILSQVHKLNVAPAS
jgi:endonuclease/exonuclease/phosphatase family metal-dependent hydrolase